MKKLQIKRWLLLCFLALPDLLSAQDGPKGIAMLENAERLMLADSVGAAIETGLKALPLFTEAKDTENEFRCLDFLGSAFQKNQQISSSLNYYLKALHLAEKSSNVKWHYRVTFEIGNLYESAYAYENAFNYYQQSLTMASGEMDREVLLEKLGKTARSLGDNRSAMNYYQELADFHRSNGSVLKEIRILKHISDLHQEEKDFEKALEIQIKILNRYRELSEINGIANTENNIGYLYNKLEMYQKAAEYFELAAYLDEQLNVPAGQRAKTLTNIGIAYHNAGQGEKAIQNLLAAWELHVAEKNHGEMARLNVIVASIYLNQRDLYNARYYANIAIKEAKIANDPQALSEAYHVASDISRRSSDYEEALDFYKNHLSIRDSLLVEQRLSEQQISQQKKDLERTENDLKLLMAESEMQEMNLRQLQLEAEKQEKELDFLRQQKELQDLTIRQQQLENIKSRQELELTRQRLATETKDQEIKVLQQQRQIHEMALEQQELEEKERKATITALERDKELQNQKLEKAQKIRAYTIVIFIFGLIIIILMLIGFIHTKSTSRKLAGQKEDILHKNELLANQNEELEKRQAEITGAYELLRETHLKLKNAQSQMLEQEKMASLGQLTAGIAHEINNPINFVSSNVNPLRMDLQDIKVLYKKYKEAREKADPKILDELDEMMKELDGDYLFQEIEALISGIEEGAIRTKDIVAGLKKFSRTDQSEITLASIHEGIDSTLVVLKNAAKHKVEIIKNYDPRLPSIYCYPGKLNQVFMNIVNNAIQAISDKGQILITTRYKKAQNGIDQDHVMISIKDTGAGIPEKIRNKIFDPFFTTKDVGEGTGLGLSISYGIIQQHHGKIEVQSEEGRGTEFIITLPVSVKEQEPQLLS